MTPLAIYDAALTRHDDGDVSVELFVEEKRRVGFVLGRDGREHWWIATQPPSTIDGSGPLGEGPGERTTARVLAIATRRRG